MSDAEWKLFEDIFPEKAGQGRGRPAVAPCNVLNSLSYILITGCRWRDLPQGPQWASKSSGHRRIKAWHHDGTLNEIKSRLLGSAESKRLIQWNSGAVDGFFSPGKGGGAEVAYGFKGKGGFDSTAC